MAINFTWDCRTVDVHPTASDASTPPKTETDVVYNVHWIVTGTEEHAGETYTASSIGTQTVPADNFSSFTSFDKLKNSDIVTWTKAAMESQSTGSVTALETGVSQSLADKITPSSITLTVSGSI